MGAITLSRLDQDAIRWPEQIETIIPNKREREECINKLEQLGLAKKEQLDYAI